MKGIAAALPFIILLSTTAASTAWAAEQRNLSIDNATRTRIVTAAVAANSDWQTADVEVSPDGVLDLNRNGCIFMVAVNPHVWDGILSRYVLLPDGRIAGVDITGNAAAATVLRLCGQDADANWWAHIIVRLSEAAGAVPVINGVPDAFAKLVKAGLDVKPPTLTRSEGATTVEFFAGGMFLPVGYIIPLHIRATLPVHGDLTVIVNKLGGW